MAVTDFLERGALINPEGLCVIMGERKYTYRQMLKLMNRIANGLIANGYGIERNAAVLSDNDPIAYGCTMGIMRSGMAYVPMDFRNSKEDNYKILDFGDCEVLFYQSRFHDQVQEFRPRLPKLKLLVYIDKPIDDTPSLMDWIAPFPDASPKQQVPLDATAWLQTGSGTSGDFKMAMQTHRQYHSFIANHLIWILDAKPVMLAAAPITHAAGGLSYHILACGGKLVVMEKPDPQLVLRAIQEYKITKLFLPPTVIYRLLAQSNVREFDYSSLKYLIYSAAPMLTDKLRIALDIFGPVIAQGYGQTEALGITSMSPEEYFVDGRVASDFRLSAAGRPAMPFSNVVIMNDSNEIMPSGEVGEICVRGDQVMKGYYKNPYTTQSTIIDGWCHTGDVGFFDEEGYLHINDRKKDMIISGGFNIYPSEIEQVISSFEAVQECAVIGVPDEDWGEAVKAVVELSPGKTVTAGEIIALCKQRLGSVKAPKSVDFIDELPRSPRGKVLKRELRDRYWKGLKRKI
jgi:acyl-CoA synthetase (AMP-forming)/AMP-acid ligase II